MAIDDIILTALTSTTITGLLLFTFKNFILSSFKKDLETHKHLLEIQMIKAQLQSKEAISIFQELFEKIEKSLGAMINLTSAFQDVSTWSNSNSKDIIAFLNSKNATDFDVNRIATLFHSDHPDKIKELNKYVEMQNLIEAQKLYNEARNFTFLKSLHLTDEIEKLCLEVLSLISSELVGFSTHLESRNFEYYARPTRDNKLVTEKTNELKVLLRNNISPKLL